MILKNLHEKRVKVMNKNSEIYGACRKKKTPHQFFIVRTLNKYLNPSAVVFNTENFLKS